MRNDMPTEMPTLMQPFSFEGWEGEEIRSRQVNFAKARAEQYLDEAAQDERDGCWDLVADARAKAAYWQRLQELSPEDGQSIELNAALDGAEHIDALLERAKVSDRPLSQLFSLALQIHSGLLALASHGNEQAAFFLVSSLSSAVDDFNMLAWHKPEAFRGVVRSKDGIPGIITPHVEKTEANAELVTHLEVATDYAIKLPIKRSKGRQLSLFKTPRNLWAARLVNYIEGVRILLECSKSAATISEVKRRKWLLAAGRLHPYSADTWRAWADVAWQVVLEATEGHPEREVALSELHTIKEKKISKRSGKPLDKTLKASQKEIREALARGFEALAGDNLSAI